MRLFVGLGNPGAKHANNRHNIGFMAVDEIARRHGFAPWRRRFQGETSEGTLDHEKVVLLKPTTYMNNSGLCVAGLMNFYDIPLENLLVIYDDIDLATGDVRIRQRGSAGTHNGMRSIIQHLGNPEFSRIRIGIGRPRLGSELVHYVLGRFPKSEFPAMEMAVIEAVKGVDIFVKDGVDLAMNRINVRKKAEEKKTEESKDHEKSE